MILQKLVFTADGIVTNFYFIEELVSSAQFDGGWKFTAHKPALDISDVNIKMGGYDFRKENISFYSTDVPGLPDEIDITIVHSSYDENNRGNELADLYFHGQFSW